MKLFKRLGLAFNVLMNGPKVPKFQLKEWKGTDVEFGAYLASRHASIPQPCDSASPYAFLYASSEGIVVGLTTRWPGRYRNYVVVQSLGDDYVLGLRL